MNLRLADRNQIAYPLGGLNTVHFCKRGAIREGQNGEAHMKDFIPARIEIVHITKSGTQWTVVFHKKVPCRGDPKGDLAKK